ncbi:MAG: DUF3558 domain-containing protein [Actinomycetota bacterium]|nr:DUF3558 domain-containing protein [Actinomycetota bacterium]
MGAVSCSTNEVGEPRPGVSSSTTQDGRSTASNGVPGTTRTSAPNTSDDVAKNIEPCDLVSAQAAQSLSLSGEPKVNETARSKSCSWRVNKGNVADSYNLGFTVFWERGIKDIVTTGEVETMKIGKHEAVRYQADGGGACAVAFAISEKSRVDVTAVGGDASKLCAPVVEAAQAVELELP